MKHTSLLMQKGFTLIELMISLTLGLVIMLAAMQLFVTNQIGFNLQRNMGNVQENGRFALDYINSTLRSAEYSVTDSDTITGIVTSAAELPGGTAALVTCNDCVTLGIDKSDQLVIRQLITDTMTNYRDCEGNSVPASTKTDKYYVVNRYFVRADTESNSASALACDGGYYKVGAAAMTNYNDAGVVLLSNIDSFQIQLGISALPVPDAGKRFPVRYVNFATYNAIAGTKPVISAVKVAVLVRSSEQAGADYGTPSNVRVLDKIVNGSDLQDKRVHRLFSSTVALRNAI